MKNEPDSAVKLRIYSLFKQATLGDCDVAQPSALNFVAKAKWQAWNSLKSMTKEDASSEYVKLIADLVSKEEEQEGSSRPQENNTPHVPTDQTLGIHSSLTKTGVMQIFLDRPGKKNAITPEMYETWTQMLNEAALDSNVKVVCVTGTGDYFSSGNDMSTVLKYVQTDVPMTELAAKFRGILQKFVAAFIDFPKPLIGLINGPAVGITVTTLGLYDYVLAAENASFHTPFVSLGLTPEGCSSLTFPQIMGTIRAKEMLLFEKCLTAMEAHNYGLVTRVVSRAEFPSECQRLSEEIAQLRCEAMRFSKQILRSTNQQLLHTTNHVECDRLAERWTAPESIQAVLQFFQRSK